MQRSASFSRIKTAAVHCMAAVLACVPFVADANDQALGRALLVCAKEVDDASRLRCVDTLISSLRVDFTLSVDASPPADRPAAPIAVEAPLAEVAIDVPDRPEVEPAPIETAKPVPTKSPVRQAETQLVSAYQDRKKRWYFELDNGEVWHQTEARTLPGIGDLPVVVTVSRGVFGSHNLRSDAFPGSIKVKRFK